MKGEQKVNEEHKDNKIIAHFKKHKWKYISGVFLAGGITIGYLIKGRPIINNITGRNIVNNVNSPNAISTILERRGHPGYIVRCTETGEVFASQNRCAEMMGVSANSLSKHLNGQAEHVNNLHFERLGLAE